MPDNTRMARQPRTFYPGAIYHVTLRGNHRKRIFFCDADRFRFCMLLQEGVERFGHRILAFCLMDNHVHLVIQAGDKPISKAMQNVAFRFSQYLNKQSLTTGHRFQGRFNAKLVDQDSYLVQLVKYTHLNPVKAGICTTPEQYPWSSHNYYINQDKINWIERDFVLEMFHKSRERASNAYIQFMSLTMDAQAEQLIENPNCGGQIIGDDDFVKEIEKNHELHFVNHQLSVDSIVDTACSAFNITRDQFMNMRNEKIATNIRDAVGFFISEYEHLTYSEAGRITKKDASLFSRGAQRIKKNRLINEEINEIIKKIKTSLEARKDH